MNEEYRPLIGLEVHAQLLTASKMFCGCSAAYSGAPPNTHCCAVCAGMPGALPVINDKALEFGVLSALALNCSVAGESKFDRKNYSYPDLPKGYQISQYDEPLGTGGWISLDAASRDRWGITRLHLEEDTGKSTHTSIEGRPVSLVDYNRSGVPLMEIVTNAEHRSPEEARELFAALRQILMYLGVNDGDLQEGSMRVDANISLSGADGARNPKVEIKNLNSFRALERSLAYEIDRQREILATGGVLEQETRGWSEKDERTIPQRSKEFAEDYRYFPEPDLPPLVISPERVERLRAEIPELPLARWQRLQEEYGVGREHAAVLTRERPLAEYFEAAVRAKRSVPPRVYANWITGDVLRLLGEQHRAISEVPFGPDRLADLLGALEAGDIGGAAAKQVLEEMFESGATPEEIIEARGLRQVADQDALDRLVDQVLSGNPGMVEQYRGGKTNVIQALVGQAMKASRGTANPQKVREILERKLT